MGDRHTLGAVGEEAVARIVVQVEERARVTRVKDGLQHKPFVHIA
jgi:hypothetical protein